MEKSNWDVELAKDIVVAYDEELPLSVEEREVIIALLGYPDKFRKLINSYFNGKKSWLSIRIFEKLNEVVASEENRWICIRELENWFGVKVI
jgi:hypothetical protein